MPRPRFIRNASVQSVEFAALYRVFWCRLAPSFRFSILGMEKIRMVYTEDFCFGTRDTPRLEMSTHMSAAGPAAASTGTGAAASTMQFRTWERTRLTEMPQLSQTKRDERPNPLPNDPKRGDVRRSKMASEGWVLHWKYVRSAKGAPRSTCRKEPFYRYDPDTYEALFETFLSESAAAVPAASGRGCAGGTAASGTAAAVSPTSSSAGAGEYSNGGNLELETFSQGSLPPANGAVGSTAASVASAASAGIDATTKYQQLRAQDKLPRRGNATEHGPKKPVVGKNYYITGIPDDGFELVIKAEEIKAPHFRGWKMPPDIYTWKPSA